MNKRHGKLQSDEIATTIRTELNNALENADTIDKLVSAIRKTLIYELTPIITKSVAETLNTTF